VLSRYFIRQGLNWEVVKEVRDQVGYIAIQKEDVRQLTNEIWGGMLQMELAPTAVSQENGGIGACVQITGAWEGAVRVDCSLELARVATSRFLAVEPKEVTIDQIRDAVERT
jgi:hypothetical protein